MVVRRGALADREFAAATSADDPYIAVTLSSTSSFFCVADFSISRSTSMSQNQPPKGGGANPAGGGKQDPHPYT